MPIPTYYGDEICHVNGIKYAKDVTADVLRYKARRMGFGTGPSGPVGLAATDTEVYELKPSPHSSHGVLLAWTAAHAPGTTVLDVGCSDGQFGALVRAQGHRVDGVDLVKHEGVGERLDDFVEADLSHGPAGRHRDVRRDRRRRHPRARRRPRDAAEGPPRPPHPGGEILVSVPNFGHWYPRGKVALGRFDYDQRGPLDHTHVRFFTRRTFERLVNACGLAHRRARRRRLARRRARPRGRVVRVQGRPRRCAGRPGRHGGLADAVRLPVPLPARARSEPPVLGIGERRLADTWPTT